MKAPEGPPEGGGVAILAKGGCEVCGVCFFSSHGGIERGIDTWFRVGVVERAWEDGISEAEYGFDLHTMAIFETLENFSHSILVGVSCHAPHDKFLSDAPARIQGADVG